MSKKYDFKIHSTDRNRSLIGVAQAPDLATATQMVIAKYQTDNPDAEIIHLTIENDGVMSQHRKDWES